MHCTAIGRCTAVAMLVCSARSLVGNGLAKPTVRNPYKAVRIRRQLRRFRGLWVAIENLSHGLTRIRSERRDIDERLDSVFPHGGDHGPRVGVSHQDHRAAGPLQYLTQSGSVVG